MTKNKKKPEREGHNINVIVDDELRAALEKAIEKHKESQSVVVRKYLRDALAAEGLL